MVSAPAGSGPIFLNDVGCTGPETTLLSCGALPLGINYCTHAGDVGVHCEGKPGDG